MRSSHPDRIAAVGFDFYNTLAHLRRDVGRGATLVEYLAARGHRPGAWRHEFLYRLFERHDVDYSPDAGEEAAARYRRGLARRAFELLDIDAARGQAETLADEIWSILGPQAFAVFPEVTEVLARLGTRGYRLVVVSNWQRGLKHFLVELGLSGFFEHVIVSAEVGIEKPDSRIFAEVCRRLGRPPGQVLHVGDSRVEDYQGARDAGLRSVLLCRTLEEHGDGTVASLEGLLDLLEEGDR